MLRFRPRVSLLSALLLMTIVGLAIVVVQQWRHSASLELKLRKLGFENRRLRDEVGELTIDDPSKIHAIAVRTDEDRKWKWRVWVPDGKAVEVRCQWGNVPRAGVPKGQDFALLNGGEHWIELKVKRGPPNNDWTACITTAQGTTGTSIDKNAQYFDWADRSASIEGVGYMTQVASENDKNFVLLRQRATHGLPQSEIAKMDIVPAGFIIWLERK